MVKPNREPDYIDKYGGYYWFYEMIWISGHDSLMKRMLLHPEYNALATRHCQCEDSCDHKIVLLPKAVNEYKRFFDFREFESIVLGSNDE